MKQKKHVRANKPNYVRRMKIVSGRKLKSVLLKRVGIVRLIESGAEKRGEESDGAARIQA